MFLVWTRKIVLTKSELFFYFDFFFNLFLKATVMFYQFYSKQSIWYMVYHIVQICECSSAH